MTGDHTKSLFPDKGDLFQDLFDSNPQPMFVYDLKSLRFLAVNDAAINHYGYSLDEFLAMDITQIRPPEEVGRLLAMVSKLGLGVQRSGAWTHCKKDGTRIQVEISSHGILFDGRQARFVIVQDVTERNRAVEALRRSEEKYRDLFENANDAIFILGPDLRYLDVNKKAVELLGYTRSELLMLTVLDLIPAEQRPRSQAEFEKIVSRGSYEKFIGKVRTRDGRWLDVEVSSSAIIEHGKVIGSRDIMRDITDRKKMEDELLRAQKLESIGALAGGIAHDFNNLLTAIQGNISLARLCTRPGDGADEPLERAEQASARAQALTQQLLTFSRGGAPIRKALNICKLVRETVTFSLHGSRTLSEFDISDEGCTVEGDEGQLSQVFNNLAINADQAMPEGGTLRIVCGDCRIAASSSLPLPPGDYVKITFRDEGIGIPANHFERIFDPYFTTKQKGSGLGLATSYSIVKRHGGHITVESTPGRGATFEVYLPRSLQAARQENQETFPVEKRQGSILVMDDEAMIREVAAGMLKRLGYEVACAPDGQAALDLYDKARREGKPFDAVILDLTVPGGMGGSETLQKLLEMDRQARVIVSSGYSNDPIMADYGSHGFNGVIAKPYTIRALDQTLRECLQKRGP